MAYSDRYWAVVPAAGVGSRMAADRPKQYLQLSDKTVLEHTLARLIDSRIFQGIVVAVSAEDGYWPELPIVRNKEIHTVKGGRERVDSVLSGLKFLVTIAGQADWVLVHDAARPCLTEIDIHRLIESVKDDPVGGILALPLHDTLKEVVDGKIITTRDRRSIWRAQTPQMFRLSLLIDAITMAIRTNQVVTDEASALELIGEHPCIVDGRPDNIKITRPEDLPLARFYLDQQCCE